MQIEEHERVTDILDQASQVTSITVNLGIAAVQRAAAPDQVPTVEEVDGVEVKVYAITECVACGDDLIPSRLEHGFIHCVPCKTKMERKRNGL